MFTYTHIDICYISPGEEKSVILQRRVVGVMYQVSLLHGLMVFHYIIGFWPKLHSGKIKSNILLNKALINLNA